MPRGAPSTPSRNSLQPRPRHPSLYSDPELPGCVHYHGTGTSDRRYLLADERGSIIAEVPTSGAVTKYTYDPFGAPAATTPGRFGFTGQMWLADLGLYNYKGARLLPGPRPASSKPTLSLTTQGRTSMPTSEMIPVNGWDPSGLSRKICRSATSLWRTRSWRRRTLVWDKTRSASKRLSLRRQEATTALHCV